MLEGLRMLIKDETDATLYKNVGILYNGYWVNFLRRQSARGCEAGHSPPCSADIKNERSSTNSSTLPRSTFLAFTGTIFTFTFRVCFAPPYRC